uniref:Linker for activation of T cells n=1 Tax=Canis lupus familiaris TaxID=9615 RepID=A0A8C0PV61_CANLF
MEAVVLIPYMLGLLLLPLLAVVLCVRCRELPGEVGARCLESLLVLGPVSSATVVPWPSAPSYGPVTSYPPLSQPDLLPIPRSPQPPGGSHRMPSSRQDSDGANSVASYENEGASGAPGALVAGRLGPGLRPDRCVVTPEHLSCEDNDEDEEEEYHNEGYLEVLPDSTPATGTAVPPAPVPSNPSLRDSAFSSEFPGDCPCGRPSAVSPLSRTPVPQGALPLRPPDFLSFPSSFLLRGLSLLLFATFL